MFKLSPHPRMAGRGFVLSRPAELFWRKKGMRMSLRRYGPLGLLFLAAVVGLVGCGSPTKAVKVQGTVTLDGKPFPGATVTFTPVEATGKPASGRSESDGGFQLTTFKPDDGALPGDYKVVV